MCSRTTVFVNKDMFETRTTNSFQTGRHVLLFFQSYTPTTQTANLPFKAPPMWVYWWYAFIRITEICFLFRFSRVRPAPSASSSQLSIVPVRGESSHHLLTLCK